MAEDQLRKRSPSGLPFLRASWERGLPVGSPFLKIWSQIVRHNFFKEEPLLSFFKSPPWTDCLNGRKRLGWEQESGSLLSSSGVLGPPSPHCSWLFTHRGLRKRWLGPLLRSYQQEKKIQWHLKFLWSLSSSNSIDSYNSPAAKIMLTKSSAL